MTISFSGLASGLDTSAWIKSLTALRQAKVNTLSAQKEKVTVSQNALATIKSYFTSFRSSLEKLTDAKFGISTMDLFTQNLATTTNLKSFTATATTDAEEKDYKVKVNKLATATKAKSTYVSVVENKTTAVKESTLKDIGVQEGEIGVFVNGVEKGVYVSESDTLASLISKLKNVGVDASYNDTTGVFNVNISVDDIHDYSGTGLADKLHLEGVNEAYQSTNKLQVVETKTRVERATSDTLIKDLDEGYAVRNDDYVKVENASGQTVNISINENTTIGNFVNALSDAGLYANFDEEEGILEISGGKITGGTFDAKAVFGLKEEALSAMSTGTALSETVIVPDVVTLETKLVEDLGVSKGYLQITKPDGTLYYEKIRSGQTMSDLMADLGNLGINTSLDPEKGVLTITGGSFVTLSESEVNQLVNSGTIAETEEIYKKGTNLLSALGFDDSKTSISSARVRSQALTFKKTNVAFTDDLISHYIDIPANNQIIIHEKTGEEIGTVTVDATTSFENLFGMLAEYDVDGQIHDGKVMIDSNRELYITGDVVTALGMETTYTTIVTTNTVGKSQTTAEKTYDVVEVADSDSVINDFLTLSSSNNKIVIKDKDGNVTDNVTVSNSLTFGELFNVLAPKGVIGQINNGILTLVHNDGGYVDGSFCQAIGMTTTYKTVVTTTTVGGTQTTSAKTYKKTDVADVDSVINNFLTLSNSNNQLVAKDVNGNVKGTVTVTNTMKFGDLFASLAAYGVDGDINDGQLTFVSTDGGYVDGSFASAMGVSTTYKTVTTTKTVGGAQTTLAKTYNVLEIADDNSVINNFNQINSTSNQIVIKDVNGSATKTVTVTNTMTFSDLFTELAKSGVYGGLHDGVLTLYEKNGGYVDGSFCRSMGMTTNYTTVYSTTTTGMTSTGAARAYTVTSDATGSTTFKQIGACSVRGVSGRLVNMGNGIIRADMAPAGQQTYTSLAGHTWAIMNGQSNVTVASGILSENTTIGAFADLLGQYGFSASIDGGYFTLSSPQGYYVKGTAADVLGLTTYSYTQVVHGTAVNDINAVDTVTVSASQTVSFSTTVTGYTTVSASALSATVSCSFTTVVTASYTKTVTITHTTVVSTYSTSSTPVTVTAVATSGDNLQSVGLLGYNQYATISIVRTNAGMSTGNPSFYYQTVQSVTVHAYESVATLVARARQLSGVDASFSNGQLYIGRSYDIYSSSMSYYEGRTAGGTQAVWGSVYHPASSGSYTYYTTTYYIAGYHYSYYWATRTATLRAYVIEETTPVTYYYYDAAYSSYEILYYTYVAGSYSSSGTSYASVDEGLTGLSIFGRETKGTSWSRHYESGATNYGTSYVYAFGNSGSATLSKNVVVNSQSVTTGSRTITMTSSQTVSYSKTTTVKYSNTQTVNLTPTLVSSGATGNVTVTKLANNSLKVSFSQAVAWSATLNTSNTYTLTAKQSITVDTISTSTITANKSQSDHNTYSNVYKMDGNTRLSETGLGAGTVTVVHKGTVGVINLVASDTIDSLIARLGAYGVEASVDSNGAMTFKGTSDGYIIGATGSAATLGAKGTYSSATTSVVYGVTSAANQKSRLVNKSMNGNTSFADLGLAAGTATVNYKGNNYTISMNANNTMYDFMTALGGFGISAMIKDGKMTVTGTNDGYVSSTSGGIASLGITTSTVISSNTVVNGTNSAGTRKTRQITQTMNSSTTLAELGWAAGSVKGYYEDQAFTISMQTNNSIGDLISALASRGIASEISNDGKLTLTGSADGYITEATGGLSTGLGIVQSTIKSTSTVVGGVTSAANSKSRTITNTMVADTTFANLGLTAGTAKVNYLGNDYTISMNANNTMNDFMTALGGYGISAVIKDGKMTVTGTESGYILSTTGGVKDLGIKTSTLKTTTTTITGDNGLSTTLIRTTNPILSRSTKLSELQDTNGNNLGITTGAYYIYRNGVRQTYTITADMTVNDFMAQLAQGGLIADISENGSISISGRNDSYLASSALGDTENSNIVSKLFTDWNFTKVYDSNNLSIPTAEVQSITRDTKLKNISSGQEFKEGVITILKDGVKTNLFINQEDTVGTFMDELSMHGFDSVINDKGQLIVKANGNSKLQNYSTDSQSSNVLNILGLTSDNWIMTSAYQSKEENVISYYDEYFDATEDTMLSAIKSGNSLESITGDIEILVDGVENTVQVTENETVGSLLNKFRNLGLEATISGGKILIQSGYKDIDINESGTTSALGRSNSTLGLSYFNDIGGFASSSAEIISTTYEDKDMSVSNWADLQTELSMLNITAGTFSVFRNGEKATINVTSDDTFATLQSKIQNKLNDVEVSFEDGYLTFSSNKGNKITTGSSTDTSNLSSITGLSADGKLTKSARELYKVNTSTNIIGDNLFREDNIYEGTFTIGEEEFTIDSTTTLNDIINMINNSEKSGATAYWDSVDGKLVLNSKSTGAMYVNVEKGTSNFTDVMGLTSTKDGVSRMNTKAQQVGDNAEFTINGTSYTSNSNTINSDISRIKGVTLQLKQVSAEEESTAPKEEETLSVSKDRETLANAVEEVVGSYNELMTNVDKAISAEGDLKDQTTLKMIRNQLRSLMTSSILDLSTFKNVDAIGISVDKAVGSNISTSNLTNLTFDREKFNNAFNSDPLAVKTLLIGTDTTKGVLTRIEELVESTLTGVSGYFDTQNTSYIKQIQQFNERISKENRATLRYQEILESKFSAMDLLISQMQQQYSSFLTT